MGYKHKHKLTGNIISYDMANIIPEKSNSQHIVNSLIEISYELSHNNLYLSKDNALYLVRLIICHNLNKIEYNAAANMYTNLRYYFNDMNFRYFTAIDCDGNNIILFYFSDEYNHSEYFLKAMTETKYEDESNFSFDIYDMMIYYRIENYDCTFSARKGNDDIETNVILDGEVFQGSIYKNDLSYIHEIESSIIDKIIDIKNSVEVRCKLAGII